MMYPRIADGISPWTLPTGGKTLWQTLVSVVLLGSLVTPSFAERVQVVTTLAPYAALAREVGGDRVEVRSIARGDEDAHFVKPKPSLALMLRTADLFVTTGLDLELWAPTLVDKSGNRRIRDGQPGFVNASRGVPLLDVPSSVSRSAGDIHVYGNPHIFTSPLNAKIVARNIADGLKRVDPTGESVYDRNLAVLETRLEEALYGRELVELLGPGALDPLVRSGQLFSFLENQSYRGTKLTDLLGGWLGRTRALRGAKIVTYHKNWTYFTELFGLQVVDYVEAKPGIPPSARHVHHLVDTIRQEGIRVLLAANYFDPKQPGAIAERTGCRAVVLPMGPTGAEIPDYIALVDLWVTELLKGFET